MENIKIGEPVFQRNLLLFPIYGGNGKGKDYENLKTIEEACKEGFGKFEEIKNHAE